MNLANVDLNLLLVLDALLRDSSVTAAARRLGLSRPAMSNALARLRRHFDDPILVRVGRRMALTPKAHQLAAPARAVLGQVEQVLDPSGPFDPATSMRWWRPTGNHRRSRARQRDPSDDRPLVDRPAGKAADRGDDLGEEVRW